MSDELPIWADPTQQTHQVQRPTVKCWGCGKPGCIDPHWGNWCFPCNLKRMTRIDSSMKQIAASIDRPGEQ